jgi:hypothetical protein
MEGSNWISHEIAMRREKGKGVRRTAMYCIAVPQIVFL